MVRPRVALMLTALISMLGLAGCGLVRPLPPSTSTEERLAQFPTEGLPLAKPVRIHWDDHLIPFIEAEDDADAAFALGLVHAHLRLGQMAFYRRVAQGRIAEIGGPLAVDIDHGIRLLGFDRAAEEIEASLPAETRLWLTRFVEGINYYQASTKTLPFEYAALGLDREPWEVRDLLTFGRLAGTDVTWLVWFNLLGLRNRPDWPELWARLLANGSDSRPSFAMGNDGTTLSMLLQGMSRSGSNSVVVAGARSHSGSALIANDPHLGINLPNVWLIVGLKSPSYHVVGLMVPGLPVFGIGRNPEIAWGGTNMRAATSDLIDLSQGPVWKARERRETIRVRWWRDRQVTLRDSPFGPIISDAPQLSDLDLPPLALRWTGHQASDEITAFLNASRARSFEEFRQAFGTFSVPGQNMLYADQDGNIGQVMAVRVPDRSGPLPVDMVISIEEADQSWSKMMGPMDLPFSVNPDVGFLASANNRPTDGDVRVGYFFSPDDRVVRMAALVGPPRLVGIKDLQALQRDVYVASSVALRDAFIDRIEEFGLLSAASAEERSVFHALKSWDGHYHQDSRGPVAFELFKHEFIQGFYREVLGETDWAAFANLGRINDLMLEDIEAAENSALADRLRDALRISAERFDEFDNWGEMHRLALRHPLHFLPLIGQRFWFADVPIGGSTDSLMKTAHASTNKRHFTRYGANARHISDLSDPDENYFVLLGGQDGWLNSQSFLDQVPLWLDGRYIRVPLTEQGIAAQFRRRTNLSP